MVENINERYEAEYPVTKLKPHPNNPRKGDLDKIKESIETNGFYGSVIVQESTGYVLVGNHRLKAAKALGMKKVPATFVDVDDVEAQRILLADNRANDLAVYDNATLADLLQDLHDETDPDSLLGTGFSTYDLAEIERKVKLSDVPLSFEDGMMGEGIDPSELAGAEPGTAPSPENHVYMVNLFLTTSTAPEFLTMVESLRNSDTESITDIVWRVIKDAAANTLDA